MSKFSLSSISCVFGENKLSVLAKYNFVSQYNVHGSELITFTIVEVQKPYRNTQSWLDSITFVFGKGANKKAD